MHNFEVTVAEGEGGQRHVRVTGKAASAAFRLKAPDQNGWLDLFAEIADVFGTRVPHNRRPAATPDFRAPLVPLLTEPHAPTIRYGYGDPAVLQTPDGYYLLATSNDAPDAFPILHSPDLKQWEHRGFAFPRGQVPPWCLYGEGRADFWAPELAWTGEHYLLCFSAREKDGSLAVGLATAPAPEGPFTPQPEPLLRGGVIDAHIFVAPGTPPLLLWKRDSNARWPRLLVEQLAREPTLIPQLFPETPDAATASLSAALWAWGATLPPMEQFFLLQPLIEAAVDRFQPVRATLQALGHGEIVEAMRTPIYAQPLDTEGLRLTGTPSILLENDLAWEGHLIEGPWLTAQAGRYYLFYAGNDFSTADYGIGVAVADRPLGPYIKIEEPLLRSTAEWSGPGHPSVAALPDGTPALFLHAFFPGAAAYGSFRAVLMARLAFHPDGVRLLP